MAGESKQTTDHDTIRRWAEARDGAPVAASSTGGDGDPGVLRILFDDSTEDGLETISWEQFFDKFEAENLAFLYQEETSDGETSRFFKLVERD